MITWCIATSITIFFIILGLIKGWGLYPKSWLWAIGCYVGANVCHQIVWRVNVAMFEKKKGAE